MYLEKDFTEIINLINTTKIRTLKVVNTELINLYWEIGKYISNKIANESWGKGIVTSLSKFIKDSHPELKGFSPQNLWRMKQFFETYKELKNLSPLVREIPWTHNMLILTSTKHPEELEFYLRLTIKEKLSKRELERQIESRLFERVISSDKFLSPVAKETYSNVNQFFKDRYIFDFLSLPETFSEKKLRKSIINNLKKFILEIGKDFTFVGEEFRVQVEKKDFYIDLVFYHRELQCLVAIDLKINDFKPEYLGKLEFYLEALDRDVKKKHENPSVGIILCKNKDNKVVEYALS